MQLWKTVCSSKLLQNSEMVLFLNKCDILQAKWVAQTLPIARRLTRLQINVRCSVQRLGIKI